MQIVIEISDYDREFIKNAYSIPEEIRQKTAEAIINGIPLPKGHGDLIDRKDLIENGISRGFCNWYDEIKMADTIIKAESEG